MKPPRTLFWSTLIAFALITVTVATATRTDLPEGITLQTEGQPTIGYPRAKVHVVVFEEPKCSSCQQFDREVFPQIKKDFIDTNKIRFTVIPVSFLPNSMPAAVATLCVYHGDPKYPNNDLFFTYLDYIYHNQPDEHVDWTTTDTLIEYAKKASPAINPELLRNCINQETYRIQIEKNTEYGKNIMGGQLSTPTLYVNGIKVENLSYPEISHLIKQVLDKMGVPE